MVYPRRFGCVTRVLSKRVPIDRYDEVEKHLDCILYALEHNIPVKLESQVDQLYLKSLSRGEDK